MTDEYTPTIPEPETRTTGHVEGIELQSLGKSWKLAKVGLANTLTATRDRIFDDLTLHDDVLVKDIRHCAWIMLAANYRLEPTETVAVLDGFDKDALTQAVISSVLPHRHEEVNRTYTAWARSSLLANGLEPAKIAPEDLPHVLHQLVETGRAMTRKDFIASAEHANLKAELLKVI